MEGYFVLKKEEVFSIRCSYNGKEMSAKGFMISNHVYLYIMINLAQI